MTGQQAARKHAMKPHNDIKDWMKHRNAEVRNGRAAQAAGHGAWAQSTKTERPLRAAHPGDVRALGKQATADKHRKVATRESVVTTARHALEAFQNGPPIPRPNLLESAIPVVGPAWDFVADIQQKQYVDAALDAAAGLLDASVAKAVAKGVGKAWEHKAFYKPKTIMPGAYDWKEKVRPWMGKMGYLKPGQHGHHGLIPQNGWGKAVPDKIKNQPWNIKPMPDRATHMKIHGLFGYPKFNPLQRYWHGTPGWWKKANGAVAGHAAMAEEAQRSRSQ